MEEYICADNETARIIDQCHDIYLVLLPIARPKVRTDRGIAAPYLIDVRAFITPQVLVVRELFSERHPVDES